MTKSLQSREHQILVKFLVETRHEAGLTQRQLAKRLRVQPSWVAKVEMGERRIDLIEFVWVCEALEVDPAESACAVIAQMI
ncbi:MAG: helix-turn-helix transcriptional regulator [Planctomycetes bacterium]|nr:helix-turn-helix transcriptional regulator [Planctomycetota bacterium]